MNEWRPMSALSAVSNPLPVQADEITSVMWLLVDGTGEIVADTARGRFVLKGSEWLPLTGEA